MRLTHFDRTGGRYAEPRLAATLFLTDAFKLKTAAGRYFQFTNRITREVTDWHINRLHQSQFCNANTNSVFPLLGRSSGVRRLKAPDVSDRPVLTATYCLPPTA